MSESQPVRPKAATAPAEEPAVSPDAEAASPSTSAESTSAASTPAESTSTGTAAPDAEVAPAAAEPVPVTADPASAGVEAATTPSAVPTATPAGHQVVYVETAPPPRKRGNRVVGVLLAVLGAVVFTGLYAVVAALIYYLGGDAFFGQRFGQFVSSALFWVPILVFVLAFILEVVIVNRGGWAAHVFGSLLLAFVVYFASIGLLLLVGNVFTHQNLAFSAVALVPQVIAAAVIAREVAIWLGLAIAVRGRRVRTRNTEARAQYDRELAEKRAQYEKPVEAAE